jgi:hypothetical protein
LESLWAGETGPPFMTTDSTTSPVPCLPLAISAILFWSLHLLTVQNIKEKNCTACSKGRPSVGKLSYQNISIANLRCLLPQQLPILQGDSLARGPKLLSVIEIFINCKWVGTRWQWSLYILRMHGLWRLITLDLVRGGLHGNHVMATWKRK